MDKNNRHNSEATEDTGIARISQAIKATSG
jgi:hypothetical protein